MKRWHCNVEIWHGLHGQKKVETDVMTKQALDMRKTYWQRANMFAGKTGYTGNILYSIVQHDARTDRITTIYYFNETYITEEEQYDLHNRFPHSEIYVMYAKSREKACEAIYKTEKSKHIAPLTLKEANNFVKEHHRHHDTVTGCKFAIGLYKARKGMETLIGVAICGRPVSRMLDDGYTLEINRLCVTEEGNCCSMLYGACCRIAKEMGYQKIITYILESESGTTLRASNFVLEDACCGGTNWTGKRKRTETPGPEERKQRWVRKFE